ncbi:hypothetical protein FACS1894166_09930 [Bacilli bacterium]|nr:hypothetical protein FACS1894166_09930 [Bacilli bacterium]
MKNKDKKDVSYLSVGQPCPVCGARGFKFNEPCEHCVEISRVTGYLGEVNTRFCEAKVLEAKARLSH